MIPAAREVLGHQPLHLRGVEDALRPKPRRESSSWSASRNSLFNHAAIGIPNPFFARLAMPGGSVRAIARLRRCLVSKRRSLRLTGTRLRNSTSSTSRNGARTSSPHAMLARSTFTRMSSCRYVVAYR